MKRRTNATPILILLAAAGFGLVLLAVQVSSRPLAGQQPISTAAAFDRYFRRLVKSGDGIVVRGQSEGYALTLTIDDRVWRATPYADRLTLANTIWQGWAAETKAADRSSLSLQGIQGRELGGKSVWGVAWVERF